MVRKITAFQFFIVSFLALSGSIAYQIHLKKSCAWNGCFPAEHPTIGDIFFGLPIIVLILEVCAGIALWIYKTKTSAPE